jgi:hypothetical protein
MHGFIIADKDGNVAHATLFPTAIEAEDTLCVLRTEWPGEYDSHRVRTARIATDATLDEVKAAKETLRTNWRDGMITGQERQARENELHEWARDRIREWVLVLPGLRAVELLRIARGPSDECHLDPERNLLDCIADVLDLSDPDDAADVFDCAHKALDRVEKEWDERFLSAAE